jgi:hypothetical protein
MGKNSNPKPIFEIGEKVAHKAFTDSQGKHHEAVTGLTVAEREMVDTHGDIPIYYRIKAIGENGHGYVSAAERFFEAEG